MSDAGHTQSLPCLNPPLASFCSWKSLDSPSQGPLGSGPCPPFRLHTPSFSPTTPCAPAALPFLWLHKHTKLTFSDASHLPSPRPPTLFPRCPHGCHFFITRVSAETSPSQGLPWPLPQLLPPHSFTRFYILHQEELSYWFICWLTYC